MFTGLEKIFEVIEGRLVGEKHKILSHNVRRIEIVYPTLHACRNMQEITGSLLRWITDLLTVLLRGITTIQVHGRLLIVY